MKKATYAYDTDVVMLMDDGGTVVIHTRRSRTQATP